MKYISVEEYRNASKVLANAITLPERVARAMEHQRARSLVMGVYDGNATAAGMNRLVDGKDVKDTVK